MAFSSMIVVAIIMIVVMVVVIMVIIKRICSTMVFMTFAMKRNAKQVFGIAH